MSRIMEGALGGRVERLCREGDRHAEAGEHGEALACFVDAWELLPEPREAYGEASRVMGGLGRVLSERGDLAGGLRLLLSARSRLAPVLAGVGRVDEEP